MRMLNQTQASIYVVNGKCLAALDYDLVQDAARGVTGGLVDTRHQKDARDALMEVIYPAPEDGQQVILSLPQPTTKQVILHRSQPTIRTTIGGPNTITTNGGTQTLGISIGMVHILDTDKVLINHII